MVTYCLEEDGDILAVTSVLKVEEGGEVVATRRFRREQEAPVSSFRRHSVV